MEDDQHTLPPPSTQLQRKTAPAASSTHFSHSSSVSQLTLMENVNDIDLDAELDKILRDTPTDREAPDLTIQGNNSAESFNDRYLNSTIDRSLQQMSSLSLGASNGFS
jgi:hypothetical protein